MITKSKLLKSHILSDETLIVPDAFDPLSARMIEVTGFKAIQCSGMSFSISSCCLKEAHYSLKENLDVTKKIVEAVDIPVMADGEDGFGDPNTVYKTIQKFMDIGVSGINIEDQILSGPNEGNVVELEVMKQKIEAAKQAAIDSGDANFIINARTDVMSTISDRTKALEEAIERANALLEVGADMTFITYVNTKSELIELSKKVKGPISISAGIPYIIPEYSIQDCRDLQINRVSLPTALIFGAIQGMKNILKELKENNTLSESYNQDAFCSKEYLKQLLHS